MYKNKAFFGYESVETKIFTYGHLTLQVKRISNIQSVRFLTDTRRTEQIIFTRSDVFVD